MTVNTNGATLLAVERRWECPACDQTAVTHEASPHTRFHACRGRGGLAGMWAPMVPAGSDCTIEAVERQDYIGRESVQVNADGRPVMSVIVRRADGSNDTAAYAPCATARIEG
jgi:hypothetical protein